MNLYPTFGYWVREMENKKRDKKIWTAEQENALIDILYEMNGTSRKVDTGYKCGYLNHIEKELAKRFPNAKSKLILIFSLR